MDFVAEIQIRYLLKNGETPSDLLSRIERDGLQGYGQDSLEAIKAMLRQQRSPPPPNKDEDPPHGELKRFRLPIPSGTFPDLHDCFINCTYYDAPGVSTVMFSIIVYDKDSGMYTDICTAEYNHKSFKLERIETEEDYRRMGYATLLLKFISAYYKLYYRNFEFQCGLTEEAQLFWGKLMGKENVEQGKMYNHKMTNIEENIVALARTFRAHVKKSPPQIF